MGSTHECELQSTGWEWSNQNLAAPPQYPAPGGPNFELPPRSFQRWIDVFGLTTWKIREDHQEHLHTLECCLQSTFVYRLLLFVSIIDVGCLSVRLFVCLAGWLAFYLLVLIVFHPGYSSCWLKSRPWLFARHLCRASDVAWEFTASSTFASRLTHKCTHCPSVFQAKLSIFSWLLESFRSSSITYVYHVHPSLHRPWKTEPMSWSIPDRITFATL